MLAGCPSAQTVPCNNGAICPAGLACTELSSLCGPEAAVEACLGRADHESCEYSDDDVEQAAGACRAGICYECSVDRAGCHYPGWFAMSSPVTEPLLGVWVAAIDDAYAVGPAGQVLHYDGIAWTVADVAGVAPVRFKSIWGSDANNVYAAAESGKIFRTTGDGVWTEVADVGFMLTGISGSSANNVIAGGQGGGVVVRFDGVGWSTLSNPGVLAVNSIWTPGPADVFAPSNRPGEILRYQGTTWSPSRPFLGSDPVLKAIWGTSSADVYAVGERKTMYRFDGTNWSDPVVLPGTLFDAKSIWGSGVGDVFVVGTTGLILRGSADQWMTLPVPTSQPTLWSVSGSSPNNVLVVGDGGVIWRYLGDQ